MLRWLLSALISASVAAESSQVPLPDPYGLGARLVMIDYLRQRQVTIPDGASDEQIHTLFRQISTSSVVPNLGFDALIDNAVDEKARRQDHLIRLRRVLTERHAVTAAQDLSEDELTVMVTTLNRRKVERTYAAIAELVEKEQQQTGTQNAAATLFTRTDAPSGITWHLPRLTTEYEARHSPYITCRFGSHHDDGLTALQLHLVLFMPKPPVGEPRITLHAGDHHLMLDRFSLHAEAAETGPLRAEAEVAIGNDDLRDALCLIINHGNPRVEYLFGTVRLEVPITPDQRQAIRHVLAAYAAAQSSAQR